VSPVRGRVSGRLTKRWPGQATTGSCDRLIASLTRHILPVVVRSVLAAAGVVAALVVAGCGSGTPSEVGYGKVCGVTVLAGGPVGGRVAVPALLHSCPSGESQVTDQFRLRASNGQLYKANGYADTGWSARLPAGTYQVVDVSGCYSPGPTFVVHTGKTLLGVKVGYGCDIP